MIASPSSSCPFSPPKPPSSESSISSCVSLASEDSSTTSTFLRLPTLTGLCFLRDVPAVALTLGFEACEALNSSLMVFCFFAGGLRAGYVRSGDEVASASELKSAERALALRRGAIRTSPRLQLLLTLSDCPLGGLARPGAGRAPRGWSLGA